jgi:hypothetical protein
MASFFYVVPVCIDNISPWLFVKLLKSTIILKQQNHRMSVLVPRPLPISPNKQSIKPEIKITLVFD